MTPLEDYHQLVRRYFTDPDPAKAHAMLPEIAAALTAVIDVGEAVSVTVTTQPTTQPTVADLIAAEQARARRRHPDDHAGHPDTTDRERLGILESEVQEVAVELKDGYTGTYLIWEVLQVASVAADWVQAWLDDPEAMPASDLLQIIEDGVIQ
jgi:hypothetical protein